MWEFIKGFFKLLFWVGVFLQSLVMLFILLAFVGIVTSVGLGLAGGTSSGGGALRVENGSALVLNPKGVLVEQTASGNDFEVAVGAAITGRRENRIEVHDIVRAIRHAANDSKIGAIVLDLGGLQVGGSSASKAYYIADEIDQYKEKTGNPVVAVGDYYSQEQYIIASRADTIMMHDYGNIFIYGYGVYRNFVKSFLEKLKVTNHVFRVGTYKSALEPYLRDTMSPAAKEANKVFTSVLWEKYTTSVEMARDLEPGTITNYANNLDSLLDNTKGDLAKTALNMGLIDELASRVAQIDYLKELVGEDKEGKTFKQVGMNTYLLARGSLKEATASRPDVAVVTAAGVILDGEQPIGFAGGDTIAKYLDQALENDEIKSVVLRVDSPGGSVFASEIIRDKILALKEAGKPIVVSMGSLAASGGYWISANADEIWAAPSTLTGSIGIFGYFMTYENTVAEAGISTDGVGTTDISSLLAAGIGPTPEKFDSILQKSTEHGYERFLDVVTQGRDMERDYADSIAQGRVWIGKQAQELRLVDKLGSFDDAIDSAAQMAGIGDDYDVINVESYETPFEAFLKSLSGAAVKAGFIKLDDDLAFGNADTGPGQFGLHHLADKLRDEVAFYQSFNDPNALYARCVACD